MSARSFHLACLLRAFPQEHKHCRYADTYSFSPHPPLPAAKAADENGQGSEDARHRERAGVRTPLFDRRAWGGEVHGARFPRLRADDETDP